MGIITKPHGDIANGATSDATVVDDQLNTLYTLVDGNLDDNNVKPGTLNNAIGVEAVTTAKSKGLPYANDLFDNSFLYSGAVPTKDGTNPKQLDVPAYVAYILQSDNVTMRRVSSVSTYFQVSTPNSTYFLDMNPDGTLNWGGHSTQPNYITLCTVNTDVNSNISTITDTRPTTISLLVNAQGKINFNLVGIANTNAIIAMGGF